MITRKLIVENKVGLHARPAAVFAKTAKEFTSNVTVKYQEKEVNGKSTLHIMTLNAKHGVEIELMAEGVDEEEAINALTKVLKNTEL